MNSLNNQSVHGTAHYSEVSESFSFHPLLPNQGLVPNFKRNGTAQQLSNGSFEFIPKNWSRSHAELIKKLSHGRLSKTINNEYRLTITIPCWESFPTSIVSEDCLDAISALRDYLNGEEAVAA